MTERDSVYEQLFVTSQKRFTFSDPPWSKNSCHRSNHKYTTMPLTGGKTKKGGYSISNEHE